MNEITLQIMNPDDSVNSELKFTPVAAGQISLNTSRGSQYVTVDDATPLVILRLPQLDMEVHEEGNLDMPSAPPPTEPEEKEEDTVVAPEATVTPDKSTSVSSGTSTSSKTSSKTSS